ncbi:MAG TPA: hypothetical protein VFR85_14015 [Anaeromyxobacteraceae bacterium]|nr:hypothetical protein [Anaeromyxobacteraceae bacterium]
MAAGLLFVSQAMLDAWAGQGKIDFVGNVMTLLTGEGRGRHYALEPAVRFLKVLGVEKDPNALLTKVKPVSQLREMGAEQVERSVILGDLAYEVEPGFLAEVSALQAAAAAQRNPAVRVDVAQARAAAGLPAPKEAPPAKGAPQSSRGPPPASVRLRPAPRAMPKDLEEKRKEAEALARFLLDNLS